MQHPFYLRILFLFAGTTFLLAAALIYLGYKTGTDLRSQATATLIESTERSLVRHVRQRMQAGTAIEESLSGLPQMGAALEGEINAIRTVLQSLSPMFRHFPSMTGTYLAQKSGPHLYMAETGRLNENKPIRANAPNGAAYAVERVSRKNGRTLAQWHYFSRELTWLTMVEQTADPMDSASLFWLDQTLDTGESILTHPHIFSHTGQSGMTIATPLEAGDGALAINFSLRELSEQAGSVKFSPSSSAFIFSADRSDKETTPQMLGDDMQDMQAVRAAVLNHYQSGGFDRPAQVSVDREDYMIYVGDLLPDSGYGIYLAVAAPIRELNSELDTLLTNSLTVAAAVLVFSLLIVLSLSRLISTPIARLAQIAGKIGHLDFTETPDVNSRISEIANLSQSMKRMHEGLSVFSRYVPRQLVRKILTSPESARLGGQSREITVMFTDVRGFTGFSEKLSSDELLDMTSDYFEIMTDCVTAHNGVVDKFIGDAVMAFWNAPDDDADHVINACRTALAARNRLVEFNRRQRKSDKPEYWTRFGLNTGECTIGNVGSSDRMNYTPFGSVVNLASRVEGINKNYGTQILVTEIVREKAEGLFLMRPVDLVTPTGATEPLKVYELMAEKSLADSKMTRLATLSAAAFETRMENRPDEAAAQYEAIAAEYPDDPHIRQML